jgi:UDP-N-acetylmuramoyl-L-alanyl-D-glutamate--2,6-diaminopimelate ligase
MNLSELVAGLPCEIRGPEVEVAGLSYDSRRAGEGDLFFALARDRRQALEYSQQALRRGARALVWERGGVGARPAATLVECAGVRRLMASVAARFFNWPSRDLDLIGVTGTSGKTTTTYLLAAIGAAAGERVGVIGSVGITTPGGRIESELTTPEAIDLEAALARMREEGVSRVAAEISSIGLSQGRAEELDFRAALFTNLGRDHLDYHASLEDYFAAKLHLFELLTATCRPDPVVVAPLDSWGERVLALAPGRKLSFALSAPADVYPCEAKLSASGIEAVIQVPGRRLAISSPLLGQFNLLNILGAVAMSVALGIKDEAVVEGVRRCPGAPGRMEIVARPQGALVVVDYAHKPDALSAVLQALRALAPRRLLCVFGCGGDRDRGKRPLMGEIAARLADLPILTSDNPRTEDPLAIIAQVETGLRAGGRRHVAYATGGADYLVEPDRRAAIALGLTYLQPGDILVVAGKGHEDYQLVGHTKLPFDDRAVVKELLAQRQANLA